MRELIATKLDAIRRDRTSHGLRLEQLLPQLAREFEDHGSPREIRACADAVLSAFEGATVRSYVQVLVYRQTRECLRASAARPCSPGDYGSASGAIPSIGCNAGPQ